MRNLTSLEKYNVHGRGAVFIVGSPINAPRDQMKYKEALGPITIDGIEREPIGFEWKVLATPVYVGEKIGVLARTEEE